MPCFVELLLALLPEASSDCAELRSLIGLRRFQSFIELLLALLPEASNDCAELRFLIGLRCRLQCFSDLASAS